MKKDLKENIDLFYDNDLDLDNRIIYIGSRTSKNGNERGIDFILAERVIKNLAILDLDDPKGKSPITIILNSIGGSAYHGLAIFDAIKSCKNKIYIIAYGHCMSMGSVIFQAADKRIIAPNCTMMIHDGSDGYEGHTKNFIKTAEEAKRLLDSIDNIYLNKMKEKNKSFTKSKLRKMMEFDTYLSSEEAVKLGLADEILKTNK